MCRVLVTVFGLCVQYGPSLWRVSAGRARDHPVMEIVPNKALSLSLRVSLSLGVLSLPAEKDSRFLYPIICLDLLKLL